MLLKKLGEPVGYFEEREKQSGHRLDVRFEDVSWVEKDPCLPNDGTRRERQLSERLIKREHVMRIICVRNGSVRD